MEAQNRAVARSSKAVASKGFCACGGEQLQSGCTIGGRTTLPCRAWLLDPQPDIPPREPPIRFRKNVPDCWIALELIEGKNHQVRRMTAAIGHPTLRLIRVQIAGCSLGDLAAGEQRVLSP